MRASVAAAVVGLLAAFLGCACRDLPVAPYPKTEPFEAADFAVGPEDIFDVRVFDEEKLSGTYQVAPDGSIKFPLIERITVSGMTPSQIEEELTRRLADGYLQHPQVSVMIKEYRSKKVHVFGAVRAPGTFVWNEKMSIVEAVSKAGGFTALAKKNSVKVTRMKGEEVRTIFVAVEHIGKGKAPDFLLRPGDKVFVDERPF
jgi:polysaccharide export outer membrane protein